MNPLMNEASLETWSHEIDFHDIMNLVQYEQRAETFLW